MYFINRQLMKPFYKICCILGLLAVAIFADSCDNETAEADSARIKILGYDKDGNGVRDDLDSLIDAKIPDSPEKRAAYRYLAQAIQNQWAAFYENPQMSYEELLPYEIYASLGATLVDEVNAESSLNWDVFEAQIHNTMDRILFDDKIDRVFVGQFLPVAVGRTKRYPNEVASGRKVYSEILKLERMKKITTILRMTPVSNSH